MLPAPGRDLLVPFAGEKQHLMDAGVSTSDAADAVDGNAGDAARDARRGRRGEEQFVVFAAVEGLFERCAGMNGQGSGQKLDADAGFIAEMGEIGGEAVADVDSGAGEAAAHEPEALGETRLRKKMGRKFAAKCRRDFSWFRLGGSSSTCSLHGSEFLELGEAGSGAAEISCYVEQMAGAGAGAEQGFAVRNCAGEDDVGDGDGGLGEIAAGQRNFVLVGEGEEAIEEAVEPFAGELARQAKREKGGDGARAHGGEVAQSASQCAMTDGFGRVQVELEVAAGDVEIGSDGEFLVGTEAKQRTVVADAKAQIWGGLHCRPLADAREEGQLTISA